MFLVVLGLWPLVGSAATDRLQTAADALHAGDTSRAGALLEEVLRQEPESADAYNLLGQVRIQQNRSREAEQIFQKAVDINSQLADAWENLASTAILTGHERSAARSAESLLKLDPSNYNGHLIQGLVLLHRGSYSESLHHLSSLQKTGADDPLLMAMLAEDYVALGMASEERATRRILMGLQIQPKDAMLAASFFRKGALHLYVLPWLERARNGADGSLPLTLALADAYEESGDFASARTQLLDVLQTKPDDVHALLRISAVESKMGNEKPSLAYMYQAKTTTKRDPAALLEYGLACIRRHMFLDSRDALEQEVQMEPADPEAHYLLGVSFYGLTDTPAAETEFQQALKLEKSHLGARLALGVAYLTESKTTAAMREFRTALKLVPDSAAAHFYLGQSYRREAELAQAERELAEAIRLAPSDARPHAELGAVLVSQGKPDRAEAELRAALKIDASASTAHYQLGMLLRKKGSEKEAIAQLHLAHQLKEREKQTAVVALVDANAN